MRIISGAKRGKKLIPPKGDAIRPTSDRVKEALFDIIQFSVAGADCLDLFAGSGGLGLEALSRGARECTFIDISDEAIALVKQNAALAGLPGARVLKSDALTYLAKRGRYDIVFIDPPYKAGQYEIIFSKLIEFDNIKKDGIMVFEIPAELTLPEAEGYSRRVYRYGKTSLYVYRREKEE